MGNPGQSSQKPASITDKKLPNQHLDQSIDGAHAYEVVLKQYGEAMLRMGHLEAQMGDSATRLDKDDENSEQVAMGVAQETAFSRSAKSQASAFSDLEGKRMLMRQKEEEIVQLRSQVDRLRSRLDRAESETKDGRTRPKRRSRNSSKLRWMFWRRDRRR